TDHSPEVRSAFTRAAIYKDRRHAAPDNELPALLDAGPLVMHVTPSRTLPAPRTPGRPPCRATTAAHAARRAPAAAAATRPPVLGPPAATSSRVPQQVGAEATGPNTSRWSPIPRKSLIPCPPSAIAHAKSASTRP